MNLKNNTSNVFYLTVKTRFLTLNVSGVDSSKFANITKRDICTTVRVKLEK